MSWQEELRKLDEELASGRISADDYRVRRDQVLSSAVTNGDPSAQQDPNAQAGQQQGVPHQSDAASTQVVHPVSPAQSGQQTPESTQVVSSPNVGTPNRTPPWQQQQPGWTHGTAQGPGPNPPGTTGFQSQPSWNAPEADMTPPWGGSDLPPAAANQGTPSTNQGPEAFDSTSSSKRKVLGIALVVLVLAGLGTGAYFLFRNTGSSSVAAPPQERHSNNGGSDISTPTPTPTWQQPKDDLVIAPLPGQANIVSSVQTFTDVVESNRLTDAENAAYKEAKPSQARLAVSNLSNGTNILVLTVKTESPEAADQAVKQLTELQAKYKLQQYSGDFPDTVNTSKLAETDSGKSLMRAHYTHGSTVIRIHVHGKSFSTVKSVFEDVLTKQLTKLPADD